MICFILAFIFTWISGLLMGISIRYKRVVMPLNDSRDYAELARLSATTAARQAIDTKDELLRRVHRLYETRRRTSDVTARYRVARLP